MSGPQDGKYIIKNVSSGRPVGVDFFGSTIVPIVTDGSDNVWTVTKLPDGNYTLALGQSGFLLFAQDIGGNLVGSPVPSPSAWTIRGSDGGPYTIEVPSPIWPSRGWTLRDGAPKSPVVVSIIELPYPGVQWNFVPA